MAFAETSLIHGRRSNTTALQGTTPVCNIDVYFKSPLAGIYNQSLAKAWESQVKQACIGESCSTLRLKAGIYRGGLKYCAGNLQIVQFYSCAIDR